MPTGGDAVPQRLCALETLHATGTGTMQQTKTSQRWNWRFKQQELPASVCSHAQS